MFVVQTFGPATRKNQERFLHDRARTGTRAKALEFATEREASQAATAFQKNGPGRSFSVDRA